MKIIIYDESSLTESIKTGRVRDMCENKEATTETVDETRRLNIASTPNLSERVENVDEHKDVRESASDAAESEDSEEDGFFSKSFAFNASQQESENYEAAFADGLRSVFEAEDVQAEDSGSGAEDLSDAELIQRDLELERREALDASILQNDADFLFEAGARYEDPRATDADFERNSTGADASGEEGRFRRAIVRPESILEAMLFVGDRENKPLSLKRACELIRNVSEMEALEIFADLNERYLREGAPYKIVRDGEGYRLALLEAFDDVLARFGGKTKEFKLSQTAVDVLAMIAYKQPVTLAEILEVRSNAASALSQLVRRDLISVEKQTIDKKKISIYRTTERFLKLFNLNSLDELPVIGDVNYR